MKKNQTFAHNFKQKFAEEHVVSKYQNKCYHKRGHLANKNDYAIKDRSDARVLWQKEGDYSYQHASSRVIKPQVQQSIDHHYDLKEQLSEIQHQNKKLNHQRQTLLLRNQALLKKIELYQQKGRNPQYQKTVKAEIHHVPSSCKQKVHLQTKKDVKNVTMVRSQQLNKDKFQRKNESFYNFQKNSTKYKNYSNMNFVSPSKQSKFDYQLARLRNQRKLLLQSLNRSQESNQASFSSNIQSERQKSYTLLLSKQFLDVKVYAPTQKQKESEINRNQNKLQYFDQSQLNDMKATQMLKTWKQNSWDSQMSYQQITKQAQQKCSNKKYVIIKCCECKNCAIDHIPTMNSIKDFKQLSNNCLLQPKYSEGFDQQSSIRITAQKETQNKAGKHEDSLNQLGANKTILLKSEEPKKPSLNKFIEGDRYMRSCLEILKKPEVGVKDLDKKIKQVKTQNSRLRQQIGL